MTTVQAPLKKRRLITTQADDIEGFYQMVLSIVENNNASSPPW